jgi:3'(2'), 5'-bisphosphate nucleotidase
MSSEFVDVASQLAQDAAKQLMVLRETTLIRERKADRSLVTNADRAADDIIRQGLRKHFPRHAILTEESGVEGDPAADYVWVVDPLDGTKAYARGTKGFSVMIGLLYQEQPFAGVVMDPMEGHLYDAVKGQGAFHTHQGRRQRAQVTHRKDWNAMPLVTSTDFPEPIAQKIHQQLPCPWIPAINSVGIKVGLLVRQEADLYVNHHPVHYWDTAAPEIILQEAGGNFTFLDGHPLTYDLSTRHHHNQPTVATNGQRHNEFVRIIQSIL